MTTTDEPLREALAKAIEGGYSDEGIDPDLYSTDPVFHAIVWEIRRCRLEGRRYMTSDEQRNATLRRVIPTSEL